MRYFEEICGIPHPSGHEEAIRSYIRGCAERFGHRCVEDSTGNLIVYVDATPGCEDAAPMLLQAHMDMVATKVPGSGHDFLRDPIRLHMEDGHYLYADGTTLGADNAVGLVNMLALMEDRTVVHPPLELLFTVCEESGMVGIRHVDFRLLRSRRMLNMDCGDPDTMCISCAGYANCVIRLPVVRERAEGVSYALEISGLSGGHAGLMIDSGRASAVVLMGRVLCALRRETAYRIASVDCGRVQAIAPEARAVLVMPADMEERARGVLKRLLPQLQEEYGAADPDIAVTLERTAAVDMAMDAESGARCAELLYLLPYGVVKRDHRDRSVILNSVNTFHVATSDGAVECEQMVRSPIDSLKWELVDRIGILAEILGAGMTVEDSCPGWPCRRDSELQTLCRRVYRRLTGEELKTEQVNSCAETGVIAGAIPEMDIVALAPWGRGAHTPREHLDVDTLQPFWEFLTELLRSMCSDRG